MNTRNTLGLMATMLAFSGAMGHSSFDSSHRPKGPDNIDKRLAEEDQLRRDLGYKAVLAKQGAVRYYYGEKFVIARSQQNADKKAKRLGYLID